MACGQTNSRWHWRASWWACCGSAGGNMCVCTSVKVCTCVYWGTSEASVPKGSQEKDSSPLQANWEWGPFFSTSRTRRRGDMCDGDWPSSTPVSPVCSQRPASVSVSRNVPYTRVLEWDPRIWIWMRVPGGSDAPGLKCMPWIPCQVHQTVKSKGGQPLPTPLGGGLWAALVRWRDGNDSSLILTIPVGVREDQEWVFPFFRGGKLRQRRGSS